MSLKLNSSGGGSVTLQEPATASALTLNLPAVNGTVVSTGDTGSVTVSMISATGSPSASTFLNGAGAWATPVGIALNRQVFNSSGTWTKPSSGTFATIQIWGAGGGGGGGSSAVGTGGGGGGGGYTSVTCQLSDLGATVSVTIGAAGTGGGTGGGGGAGGTTSFGSTLVHSGGGGGGVHPCGGSTGASGVLSSQSGVTILNGSVENAGSARTFSGGNGSNSTTIATSVFGGNGGQGGTAPAAGTAPGGGGGGRNGNNGGGGAGSVGRIVVTVF